MQNSSTLTSALDLADEPNTAEDASSLETLRLGQDTTFLSVFTHQGLVVKRHYLDATESYNPGYYACLGEQCPACRAGIKANEVLRLPVVDRLTARIKLLDVPTQRGPGKLLTELQPALKASEPETFVVQITRNANYVYNVTLQAQSEADPEVAGRVQAFAGQMEAGDIDLMSGLQVLSAEEMRAHETIARRLKLAGGV
jgi:hypothetical protein